MRLPDYDPGPYGGSEPETQAFIQLWHSLGKPPVAALHSPFEVVNFDGPARRWAETAADFTGLQVAEDIGYPTPGSLGTYMGKERQVPILTIELPRPLGTGEARDYAEHLAKAIAEAPTAAS